MRYENPDSWMELHGYPPMTVPGTEVPLRVNVDTVSSIDGTDLQVNGRSAEDPNMALGGDFNAISADGAAGDYLETGADIFAQNPEAMLHNILSAKYPGNAMNQLYYQLEPTADYANILYFALTGQDADEGTKHNFINWLNGYFTAQMTPGQYTDVDTAINNIMNPEQNSALASYLMLGDSGEQVNATRAMLSGVMQAGMHPLFAEAADRRIDALGTQYQGEAARGQVDPFIEYLQQEMPYHSRMFPGS